MNSNLILDLISGLLFSYSFTIVAIKPIIFIGYKYSFIDTPNKRKQHNVAKVRIGGISLYFGFILAIFFSNLIFSQYGADFLDKNIIFSFGLGSLLFFIIGLIDDIYLASPFLRLIAQLISAFIVWGLGIRINVISLEIFNLNLPIFNLTPSLSLFFTIWWIVGTTNAINWIDGLDGLAAGLTSIAAITLSCINFSQGNLTQSFLALTLAGSCIAFLFYNSYPSKVLMGDGGSYFLGFSLSSLCILSTNNQEHFNLVNSLIILMIPLFDMSLVIFLRLLKNKSPFFPDKNHIHHKLIGLGLSQKNTVYLIHALSFTVSLIFLLTKINPFDDIYKIFSFTIIFTASSLFIKEIQRKSKKNDLKL